jgi:hypothetical protein
MKKTIEKIVGKAKYYLSCNDIKETYALNKKYKENLNQEYSFSDKVGEIGEYVTRGVTTFCLVGGIGLFLNKHIVDGAFCSIISILLWINSCKEIRKKRDWLEEII